MPFIAPAAMKLMILLLGATVVLSPLTWSERSESGWSHGTYNEYQWEGKIYDEPSQYGINQGRVSRLIVKKNGKVIFNYDRGYDITPNNIVDEKAIRDIVNEIEKEVM